ncbi:hypothetical protein COO91_06757 [Nostoc flagelliforme CCNUN1]|uniref:Uncharacterized protein n=1 Tax=Nostoc flagelliforme CCNUN1 TaxID=2038116 RepID=A0A2K8SZ59_9NOSO|nr:hypothetical protein COO91_06757 [Nostoc flagelliforme CCNUN1]
MPKFTALVERKSLWQYVQIKQVQESKIIESQTRLGATNQL